MEDQLKKLKNNSQSLNGTLTEHLKNLTMEAENMAKDVGAKMKQIEGKILSNVLSNNFSKAIRLYLK